MQFIVLIMIKDGLRFGVDFFWPPTIPGKKIGSRGNYFLTVPWVIIQAYLIIFLGLFRYMFRHIQADFQAYLGIFLELFRHIFRQIQAYFQAYLVIFWIDLESVWDRFGTDLGLIWDRFGIDFVQILDRFWTDFRSILEIFQTDFGPILD